MDVMDILLVSAIGAGLLCWVIVGMAVTDLRLLKGRGPKMALTLIETLSLESGIDIDKNNGSDCSPTKPFTTTGWFSRPQTKRRRNGLTATVWWRLRSATLPWRACKPKTPGAGRLTERARFLRGQVARSGSLVGATLVDPPVVVIIEDDDDGGGNGNGNGAVRLTYPGTPPTPNWQPTPATMTPTTCNPTCRRMIAAASTPTIPASMDVSGCTIGARYPERMPPT